MEGYPVKDLVAGVWTEDAFRIGKFDFPCIAVASLKKFERAIVVNRMEVEGHLYDGYLIVAPLLTKVKRLNELLAENNGVIVGDGTGNYVLEKTLFVVLVGKTITCVSYEDDATGSGTQRLKITYKIDGGAETDLVAYVISQVGFVWHYVDCELTGNRIIFYVYVSSTVNARGKNRGFGVFGDTVTESTSEKFTVDKPELI